MQFHEIANVWPMMDDDKIHELADDIKANGLINPVWTFEGKILDGRNRYKACLFAQIKPEIKEYMGDEPTAFAVSLNDKRRHMNKGQLGAIGAELEPFFAVDAKRRKKETEGRPKKEIAKQPGAILPQVITVPKRQPKASEEAAKSVGVGGRYVADAKKIKESSPEVFERLKAGRVTMQDAKREVAKQPTDDWRKDERERQKIVQSGKTVVANQQNDKNLIQWAEQQGIAARIDRGSKFGNPFLLDEDGDRDRVCDLYEMNYLPYKPSIQSKLASLSGKVLICHCYPKRCHGDCLASKANGE